MFKSLIRTLRGPSRDPKMAYISRPLPRGLPDEAVVAALEVALAANPDPGSLVETLGPALREVTGRDYEVLDRSVGDVTSSFSRTMVMIREGEVGLWPGYAARAYPLLASPEQRDAARAAIAAGEGEQPAPSPTNPVGKPGWKPPPPIARSAPPAEPAAEPAEQVAEPAAAAAEGER